MTFLLLVSLLSVAEHLATHYETYITLLGLLLWAVRSTRWGRANKKALETVAHAIENLDNPEVKAAVQRRSSYMPKEVLDAIEDAVRTADPKKPTPTGTEVLLREAARPFRPEKKEN